jgi:hypothetical protein
LAPSPRRFNPAIPPTLEQILLRVLAKEPAARYRTADQLGRVLKQYRQQAEAAGSAAAFPAPPPLSDSAQRRIAPPPATSGSGPRRVSNSQPLSRPAPSGNTGRRRAGGSGPVGVRPGATIQAGGNYAPDPSLEEIRIEVERRPEVVVVTPTGRNSGFDLLTWVLGLLATASVVGLVLFWIWVLGRITPPG